VCYASDGGGIVQEGLDDQRIAGAYSVTLKEYYRVNSYRGWLLCAITVALGVVFKDILMGCLFAMCFAALAITSYHKSRDA
jgi:MFS superfamily sulfate permease-like transporter